MAVETRTLIGLGALGAVGVAAWILWPREGSGSGSDGGSKPPPPEKGSGDGSGSTPGSPKPGDPTQDRTRACTLEKEKISLEASRSSADLELQTIQREGMSICDQYAQREACAFGVCSPARTTNNLMCIDYIFGRRQDVYSNIGEFRNQVDALRKRAQAAQQTIRTADARLKTVQGDLTKLESMGIRCPNPGGA